MKRLELAGRQVSSAQGDIGTALGTSGRISFRDDRGTDRDERGAVVTSAINRSLLVTTSQQGSSSGILVTESRPRRRRTQNLTFRETHDVIGEGGEPLSSDDDAADGDDDAAEIAEPSAVLTPEERAFENLTKRNTDFNSISSNLSGKSRTLVDWVDENDQTTERSALTGRHKKFTPLVSVAPFSTGRGPGPLKVNAVAPMQNGELVKSSIRNRKEMVEKSHAASDKAKTAAEQKITRLDDTVTRLDDAVVQEDTTVSQDIENSTSKETEISSEDKPNAYRHGVKSNSGLEKKAVVEQDSAGVTAENPAGMTRGPSVKRPGASDSAMMHPTSAATDETVSKSEGISNISAIKSMLAEKAATQKSGAQKRSHTQLHERTRARLNSLDGISKHSRPKLDQKNRDNNSAPVATEPCAKETATMRESILSEGGFPGAREQGGVTTQTKPDRPCPNTDERVPVEGNVMANNAATKVKSSKPALPGEKPRLTPKPAKTKAFSYPTSEDNESRRPSLETSLAKPVVAVQSPEAHENIGKVNRLKSELSNTTEIVTEPIQSQEKAQIVTEKKHVRNNKSTGDDARSREQTKEVNTNISTSYSPKSSVNHKDPETKQQRAIKREQELERMREALERRNREEKRAQERVDRPAGVQQERPQVPAREENKVRPRRDAPQPVAGSPPSPHGVTSTVHGPVRSEADPAAPPSSRAHPRVHPVAVDDPRSSADSSDDDDDAAPVAPQRTMSVSPRSRKRGSQAAVRFAAGTAAGGRTGVLKPRSQSVPRPGLLDSGVVDDESRRRLAGGGSGEERRSRRDEFRSRARFSLKKLLKFGRDDKRRDKDQVYGEFRTKPEIIHPIDRAGVGCVEVVSRPVEPRRRDNNDEDQRQRRPMGVASDEDSSPPTASGAVKPAQKAVAAAGVLGAAARQRPSTGLTPEGRPKPPPPPPPPSSRQAASDGSRPPQTPPTRPPPPNPQLLSRSRDGWARGQPDTDYANLGVSRADLAPKKPDRHRAAADSDAAAGADTDDTTAADNGDVTTQSAQVQGTVADPWRQQPWRLSLRKPAAAVPDRLQDSYDAVTASNLQALRQILNQVTHLPPGSERQRALRSATGLSLAQLQVAPQSRLWLGQHVLVQAEHAAGGPVVLLVVRGAMSSPPLTVPSLTQFQDQVPAPLLSDEAESDDNLLVSVHVLGASRVEPLSSLLAAGPVVTSEGDERAAWLLLLQAVWQLKALQARGSTIDETLQQVVALHTEGDPHCRLVAVLLDCEYHPRPLSACQAALCVLLMLLGVPEATERSRDGRGVSSVPDLPSSTRWELLASLLQRDDSASLRRAQHVLEFLLWAPAELAGDEAARWLHRERAALLGSVVRTQPRTIAEQLQLAFLVKAEPESLTDAAQLLSI